MITQGQFLILYQVKGEDYQKELTLPYNTEEYNPAKDNPLDPADLHIQAAEEILESQHKSPIRILEVIFIWQEPTPNKQIP